MNLSIIFRIIFIYFLCALVSCSHDTNSDIIALKRQKIIIPYDSLDFKVCSQYEKKIIDNSCIKYVTYIQRVGCTFCSIKEIAEMENSHIDEASYKDVEFIYVFGIEPNWYSSVYDKLCNFRLEGSVYLDTCNAFLSANPQIPDNELFHTFVINNEGKVLMVGNPFQNEKMEALFKKVIANERKKQKAKKSA